MTPKERVQKTLAHQEPDRVPMFEKTLTFLANDERN